MSKRIWVANQVLETAIDYIRELDQNSHTEYLQDLLQKVSTDQALFLGGSPDLSDNERLQAVDSLESYKTQTDNWDM